MRRRLRPFLLLLALLPGVTAADPPQVYVIEPDGTTKPTIEYPSLAKCLARKGWTFYGASWCPQCAKQIRMFGDDARYLPYVECSADGDRDGDETSACRAKGINAYPTWAFPDGHRRSGVYSLASLVRLSGCPAPRS